MSGYSMGWIRLPHDRYQWRALLNMVMNLRVPQSAGKFLSNCEIAGFSRRPRLHGVSQFNGIIVIVEKIGVFTFWRIYTFLALLNVKRWFPECRSSAHTDVRLAGNRMLLQLLIHILYSRVFYPRSVTSESENFRVRKQVSFKWPPKTQWRLYR
jgi:hypothetical protein